MPLALAFFLTLAGVGSINAMKNAPPHEAVSTQDRPSWCENRVTFGMSARDRQACGV